MPSIYWTLLNAYLYPPKGQTPEQREKLRLILEQMEKSKP